MQRLPVVRLSAHGLPLVVLDAEAVEHIADQRFAGIQGSAKGDLSRLGQKFFSRRHCEPRCVEASSVSKAAFSGIHFHLNSVEAA